MYKKKVARDLGANPHTAPRIRKEVLTPPPRHPPTHPPPPPPKKGYPVRGGKGVKNENSLGDHFLS